MRSRSPPTRAAQLWSRHLTSATRAVRRHRARRLGRARLHRAPSATRRAGAARSTRSTPRPVPCAGSSTRSGSRGGIRSRPAAAGSGTRSRSTTTGRLYAGNSNPQPWGGSPERPNGAAFPGPVLYTDSLLVLDARSGRLLWHDQVTPHDVRDYDFAGDADPRDGRGRRARLRSRQGGAGDRLGPRDATAALGRPPSGCTATTSARCRRRRVTVCPGLLGGVETPMAYADGRLFVPVVDLCGWGSATTQPAADERRPSRGKGRLVALDAATGRALWERRLPSPTSAARRSRTTSSSRPPSTGRSTRSRRRTGSSPGARGCGRGSTRAPRSLGDLVLFGAGAPRAGGVTPELVAFGLP